MSEKDYPNCNWSPRVECQKNEELWSLCRLEAIIRNNKIDMIHHLPLFCLEFLFCKQIHQAQSILQNSPYVPGFFPNRFSFIHNFSSLLHYFQSSNQVLHKSVIFSVNDRVYSHSNCLIKSSYLCQFSYYLIIIARWMKQWKWIHYSLMMYLSTRYLNINCVGRFLWWFSSKK